MLILSYLFESWYRDLPKDPEIDESKKKWKSYMLAAKMYREPEVKDKGFSRQYYHAAEQAKSNALFKAKQVLSH